jgi:hypothetical protein
LLLFVAAGAQASVAGAVNNGTRPAPLTAAYRRRKGTPGDSREAVSAADQSKAAVKALINREFPAG